MKSNFTGDKIIRQVIPRTNLDNGLFTGKTIGESGTISSSAWNVGEGVERKHNF